MHRIAPVFIFVILAAACSGGGSDGDNTALETAPVTATTLATTSTADSTTTSAADTTTTTGDVPDETTTTEPATEVDELAAVCGAYLQTLSPREVDAGFSSLEALFGTDAPAAVQDALAILRSGAGDIEDFYGARDSLDSYVLPICDARFRANLQPAASTEEAATAFFDAIVSGDRAAAERVAPTNIITSFDWLGYPDATTSGYNDVNGSLNMLLEPTVTVFCRAAGGIIDSCAFGE